VCAGSSPFLKYQTKPKLTYLGDVYYEGKEFELRDYPAVYCGVYYLCRSAYCTVCCSVYYCSL